MGAVKLVLDKKDKARITKARKIGVSWSSLARAYELPRQSFLNAVERAGIKKDLKLTELDVFCDYENKVLSGDMPTSYKIHLDKTRFKEFCEQENKAPPVEVSFTQELDEASKDITKALIKMRR